MRKDTHWYDQGYQIQGESMNTLRETVVEGMALQLRLVYDYLMTGRELSGLVAMTNLRVANLTTRISELRKLGLTINHAWKNDFRGARYKAYWVDLGGDS